MKKITLVFLMWLPAFAGCGGGSGLECAEGTIEQSGKCVPVIIDCAPGTRQEGLACVPQCQTGEMWTGSECAPATSCAPGTVLQGNQCVPACGAGEYWDGNACADVPGCDQGTVFNPQTGRCEIDASVCAPGTRLENGVCVPGQAPSADVHQTGDPDRLAEFDIPAAGQSVSLDGVVDAPVDINGDGVVDPDWDGFTFDAPAGTWLRITATSYGAALPAFFLGYTNTDQGDYLRYAVNPNGLETVREFYLPYDGNYVIWISDYNHLMAYAFGYSPIVVGGDDFTYYVTIDNLGTPTPMDVDSLPLADSGDLADGRLHFYSLNSLVSGDTVSLASVGLPPPGAASDIYKALMLFDDSGKLIVNQEVYRTDETADVLHVAQSSGDLLVVLDYLILVGSNRAYLFKAGDLQPDNCTTGDCSSGSVAADASQLLAWDLDAGQLFSAGVYLPPPTDDYLVFKASFLDQDGTPLADDQYIDYMYNGYLRTYAQNAKRVYLWLREVYGQEVPDYTLTDSIRDTTLLESGSDYTNLTIEHFPPYTYYPAGVEHVANQAGKLVVFSNFTPQSGWTSAREQVFTAKLDASPDLDQDDAPDPIAPVVDVSSALFPDSAITPVFFYARTNDHFLHYVDDAYGSASGNSYDVGLRTYDITDLGEPGVGQPVGLQYQTLSGMDFYGFTGHKNQWTEITVHQRSLSTMQAEVWVFNFGTVVWNWISYLWLPDSQAQRLGVIKIETAAAAGDDITVGYNSPYDGLSLVLIQDADGQPGLLDFFDLSIDVPAPPANDSCQTAEAVSLQNGSASISGDSRSASDTVTEGVCDGYIFDAGPDVFYSLVLDAGDNVDITLDGIDFNESLYLFSHCGDVAGSIVASSNESSPEHLNVDVPAGGTYYIGVDACGGGGSFTLDIVVNGS